MGEIVEFAANAHTTTGYEARPASGQGRGVVVIQEWWGLVPHIRRVADRFATEGFVALAPDLYHGVATTEPDEAGKAMMNLDIEHAGVDIEAAVRHLLGEGCGSVGVVGFCMGGGLALYAASRNPAIGACVAYYGVGPARDRADLSATKAAFLGQWGERDQSYDRATIADIEDRLRAAGVTVEGFWYPADHAFFNDDRPEVYDAEAAELSWRRTVAFLRQHLRA
ncbi:MAG: dienelactone hydrolase family protein [Candidatus Dormibacteria bacterium]